MSNANSGLGASLGHNLSGTMVLPMDKFEAKPEQDYSEFIMQYEMYSESFGWTDELRMKRLPLHLKGIALSAFTQITDDDDKADWASLKESLEERLLVDPSGKGRIGEFNRRRQRKGETVQEYACALQKLAQRAYADDDIREDALLAQFCYGVNKEIQNYIIVADPDTYKEAVSKARKIEVNFERLEGAKKPFKSDDKNVKNFQQKKNFQKSPQQNFPKPFQKYQNQSEQQQKKVTWQNQPQKSIIRKPMVNQEGQPLCFSCQKYGHMARSCPNQGQSSMKKKNPDMNMIGNISDTDNERETTDTEPEEAIEKLQQKIRAKLKECKTNTIEDDDYKVAELKQLYLELKEQQTCEKRRKVNNEGSIIAPVGRPKKTSASESDTEVRKVKRKDRPLIQEVDLQIPEPSPSSGSESAGLSEKSGPVEKTKRIRRKKVKDPPQQIENPSVEVVDLD